MARWVPTARRNDVDDSPESRKKWQREPVVENDPSPEMIELRKKYPIPDGSQKLKAKTSQSKKVTKTKRKANPRPISESLAKIVSPTLLSSSKLQSSPEITKKKSISDQRKPVHHESFDTVSRKKKSVGDLSKNIATSSVVIASPEITKKVVSTIRKTGSRSVHEMPVHPTSDVVGLQKTITTSLPSLTTNKNIPKQKKKKNPNFCLILNHPRSYFH
jgi:hypothetical protein